MKTTKILTLLLTVGLGVAVTYAWSQYRQAARQASDLEAQRLAWQAERADLQAALAAARARVAPERPVIGPGATVTIVKPVDPQQLLNRLVALKMGIGPGRTLAQRQLLGLLGQLSDAGPAALPAIRDFLATGQDVILETGGKNLREVKAMTEALLPATLRLGLFDVVRQIGGADAEKILADTLEATRRGVEVAYLTQLLEELSPGSYRDTALAAARTLLPSATGAERDYLFAVLKRFGDDSYVSTAQAQLVQGDGKVDRSALHYLQQTLGDKSVALAAQTYRDGRVTEADSKESLARVALAYVGANDQAVELFHAAVLDQALKPDQTRNLIEDLNQDGLNNRRAPTAEDLKIIANRYELTQAYLQQDYVQNNKVLHEAFREADKDLANLLQRAAAANAVGAGGKP